MQIELMGCTGAGKSTLARHIIHVCRTHGIDAWLGDDFVLRQVGLHNVQSARLRTLIVDLCALLSCMVLWRTTHAFCLFGLQIIAGLPAPWLEKLNLTRNFLKKIGIYEIIRRRSSAQQVVIVDEGTLHAAHNLFVHLSVPTSDSDMATFLRLVPWPNAAVYVTASEEVLIERTLERGHKRIPNLSHTAVMCFIQRAVSTFDTLVRESVIQGRGYTLDGQWDMVIRDQEAVTPLLTDVLGIIRVSMTAALAGTLPGVGADGGQTKNRTTGGMVFSGE